MRAANVTHHKYDGESEKFKLFADLFQTSLQIHNQLTEVDETNYIQFILSEGALQTLRNINSPTRRSLEKVW